MLVTELDTIIINKVISQIKSLKNIFYLSTRQAVIVYVFLGASIIIYSINISKRIKKK